MINFSMLLFEIVLISILLLFKTFLYFLIYLFIQCIYKSNLNFCGKLLTRDFLTFI